jgi:integrase
MAEFTRAAVTDFGPINGSEASVYMRCLSRLVIHTVRVQCEPLEREVVLDSANIDSYFAATFDSFRKRTDARNVRLRLFRLAGKLHEVDVSLRDSGPGYVARTRAPYSSREVIRLISQGRTRSTRRRRHNWQMLVALGLGCGLSAVEAMELRREDIVLLPAHVEVRPKGDRARTVICMSEWDSRLTTLVTSDTMTDFAITTKNRPDDPSGWVGHQISQMASWDTGFTMDRLRSTFIVTHVQAGTSPIHLLKMLGMKSFETIERLLPWVDFPSVEQSAATLRLPKELT